MDSPKPKAHYPSSTGKEFFTSTSHKKIPFQNSTNKDFSAIRSKVTPCNGDLTTVKMSQVPTSRKGKVQISYTSTHQNLGQQ